MLKYGVIVIVVLMLVVVGCSPDVEKPVSTGDNESGKLVVESPNLDSLQTSDVKEVKLSRSIGFGKVNDAALGMFKEQANIDIFIDAIYRAEKIDGKLDIRRPDYDVTLYAKDELYSIHLWLDTFIDGGMYTYVSDTGTGYTLTEQDASILKKLIMNLPYTPEQAEHNGDVVNIHGRFLNVDKWDAFLTNVQGGVSDHVQITSYTIEGDPIFYNLNYANPFLEYTSDTTMDAWGAPQRATSFCERIESNTTDDGIEYALAGCQNPKDEETLVLVIPKAID